MNNLFAFQAPIMLDLNSPAFKNNSKLKKELVSKIGKDKMYLVNKVLEVPENEIKDNHDHPQKITFFVGEEEVLYSGIFFKTYETKNKPKHVKAFDDLCKRK